MKMHVPNPSRYGHLTAAALCGGSALFGAGLLGASGAGAVTIKPPTPPVHLNVTYVPTTTEIVSIQEEPVPTADVNVTAEVVDAQTGAPVASGSITIDWTNTSTNTTWACIDPPITNGEATCSFSNILGTANGPLAPQEVGFANSVQANYAGARVPGYIGLVYDSSQSRVYYPVIDFCALPGYIFC